MHRMRKREYRTKMANALHITDADYTSQGGTWSKQLGGISRALEQRLVLFHADADYL